MFTIGPEHERGAPYPTKWIHYTPELAKQLLSHNNGNNRSLKPRKIAKWASMHQRGEFLVTHQGIAFAEDGTLLDGQNRLQMIVDSGKPAIFITVFGLPRKAQREMDKGTSRSDDESLKLGLGRDVDRKFVSVAKQMISMGGQLADLGTDELDEFILTHWDVIQFVLESTPYGAQGITSTVLGCLARAAYTVDREVVRDFLRVATGGHFQPQDAAAAQLGNQMRAKPQPRRVDSYAMTQRALLQFRARFAKAAVKPLYGNYFPLPGERADPLPKEFQQTTFAA